MKAKRFIMLKSSFYFVRRESVNKAVSKVFVLSLNLGTVSQQPILGNPLREVFNKKMKSDLLGFPPKNQFIFFILQIGIKKSLKITFI